MITCLGKFIDFILKFEKRPIKTTEGKYSSGDEFFDFLIKDIIKVCKEAQAKIDDLVKTQKVSEEEGMLENVVFFTPGIGGRGKFHSSSGIADKDGKNIKSDLNKITEYLKTKGQEFGLKISPKIKLIHAKDAVGSAICAIEELFKSNPDLFEVGKSFSVAMPGGGLAVVDIEVLKDFIRIITNECGYNILEKQERFVDRIAIMIKNIMGNCSQKLGLNVKERHLRLGDHALTAKNIIRNWGEKLGLTDTEIKKLINEGKAEVALCKEINLPQKSEALNILIKTGLYKQTNSQNGIVTLKVKEKPLKIKKFNKARRYAIDLYVDSMSRIAIEKNNYYNSGLIFSGPLNSGINKAILEDSSYFTNRALSRDGYNTVDKTYFSNQINNGRPEIKNLVDLIYARMNQLVGKYETPVSIGSNNNFKVLVLDNIPDNIGAAPILSNEGVKQLRDNLYEIPLEAFNNRVVKPQEIIKIPN